MATIHIKPLHGADGYLRWKESVLLRLHTVGVAHVLSDDPPAAGAQEAKKWARDDALCRGHILAAAGRCGRPWRAPTSRTLSSGN